MKRHCLILGLLCLALAASAQRQCSATPPSADSWVGTFATAPEYTGPTDMPQHIGLSGNTLRQVVRVSLGGRRLKMELSNAFSDEPVEIRSVYVADAADSSAIVAGSARYLSFGGKRSVTIAAGKTVLSDPLDFALRPLQRLTVTVAYGASTPVHMTSHRGSRTFSYIARGEVKPGNRFRTAERLAHWYNLTKVCVESDATAVAVLGNSLTDGRGSTTDAQNRWPDRMAEALGGTTGVLNLGIGANCVLRGGISQPALERFDRDILGQDGLEAVIVFQGTNDIGLSQGNSEQVAAELIEAYQTLAAKAHAQGLKAYVATITPFRGNSWYSLFHEAARQTVNEWIRHNTDFDGVIDFDRLVRDPQQPDRLRPDYSDDWLHLNPAGYEAMGRYAAQCLPVGNAVTQRQKQDNQ